MPDALAAGQIDDGVADDAVDASRDLLHALLELRAKLGRWRRLSRSR